MYIYIYDVYNRHNIFTRKLSKICTLINTFSVYAGRALYDGYNSNF